MLINLKQMKQRTNQNILHFTLYQTNGPDQTETNRSRPYPYPACFGHQVINCYTFQTTTGPTTTTRHKHFAANWAMQSVRWSDRFIVY